MSVAARSGARALGPLAAALMAGAVLAGPASAAPSSKLTVGFASENIETASTYTAGSFRLQNTGDVDITRLRIDLAGGPALFPNIIFDPDGTAGDTASKPYTENIGTSAGVTSGPAQMGGPNPRGGFSVLEVPISGMGQNDLLRFSIDNDPNSITGTVGPTHVGSISGGELHGATVTVTYAGNVTHTADLVLVPTRTTMSEAILDGTPGLTPGLARQGGLPDRVTVGTAAQTVVVSGPAGTTGRVIVADGDLREPTRSVPDPFEANQVVRFSEVPFTIGAGGQSAVPVLLTRTGGVRPAGERSGLNYITAAFDGDGAVSAPLVLRFDPGAGPGPTDPPTNPPGGPPGGPAPGPGVPAGTPGAPTAVTPASVASAVCVPARRAAASAPRPRRYAVSARQILINHRIAQAALRRANALEAWLDAGIVGGDICGGTLSASVFGPDVVTGAGGSAAAAAPSPRRVALPRAATSGRVTVSAAQLRADQRLAQLAIRRLNAIEARLGAGLTGGDVRDGSITARSLTAGLRIVSATPSATPLPATRTTLAAAAGAPGTVALTPRQLQINQRIYQAAVRRANALTARFEAGLTGDDFRPASITAIDLNPTQETP